MRQQVVRNLSMAFHDTGYQWRAKSLVVLVVRVNFFSDVVFDRRQIAIYCCQVKNFPTAC